MKLKYENVRFEKAEHPPCITEVAYICYSTHGEFTEEPSGIIYDDGSFRTIASMFDADKSMCVTADELRDIIAFMDSLNTKEKE